MNTSNQEFGEDFLTIQKEFFLQHLEDAMDEFTSALGIRSQYVKIDKVELDLGSLSIKNWETEIQEAFAVALTKIKLADISTDTHKREYHLWENTLHFLQYGIWPWNHSPIDKDDPQPARNKLFPADIPPANIAQQIIHLLRHHKAARDRWVFYASTDQNKYVWKKWIPRFDITPWILAVKSKQRNNSEAAEKLIWLLAFEHVSVNKEFNTQKWGNSLSFVFSHQESLPQRLPFSPNDPLWNRIFSQKIKPRNTDRELIEQAKQNGESSFQKDKPESQNQLKLNSSEDLFDRSEHESLPLTNLNQEEAIEEKVSSLFKDEKESLSHPINKTSLSPEQEELSHILREGIYLNNAGIVLIHPFIEGLFENLGLCEKGSFFSPYHQMRAANILQYIGCGPAQIEINEAAIPLLLCGLPVNTALSPKLEISDFEQGEIHEMLTSLIGYWTALKGTDIPSLRESFFRREGKLTIDYGKSSLKVHQSTMDILLSQLPWNLSIIKLPWMKQMLNVEWNN